MNPASLRDQIECATPREKRQHKAWQNWYLGGKLRKKQARAKHRIEAGVENGKDTDN